MDIFCEAQTKLKRQIICASDSFLVIHDGFPLVEGHLLLIPKQHFACFAEIYQNKSLTTELKKLLNKMKSFLSISYQQPVVVFEHGVAGQTVKHAHLHLVPTNKNIFAYLKPFQKSSRFKKPYSYLFIEQNNRRHIFAADRETTSPGILTNSFARVLKQPVDMNDRGLERQKLIKLVLTVKQKFLRWQEEQN